MINKFKISFCTTSMNRLFHLKETILKNISDNIAYGNIEFVLLNYGSSDQMDSWVKKKLKDYIYNGFVIYIKTLEPFNWDASHAKNITVKHSNGDIVCNIDADQYTNNGYAEYINKCFNMNQNMFLTGRKEGLSYDMVGRVCMMKSDFQKIGGYDESISGYGFEDYDIYSRLGQVSLKEKPIDNFFLKSIPHENKERFKNTLLFKEIEIVLLNKTKNKFSLLVMRKNKKFECISSIPNIDEEAILPLAINEDTVKTGEWRKHEDKIFIERSNFEGYIELAKISKGEYFYNGLVYYSQGDENKFDPFCYYALLINHKIYLRNKRASSSNINPTGYGNALIC